ncbi:MAG: RimK family alpha-L-glutamate ligase [Candidatus Gracilibacteria bacterium]|nr:RimK family alpha-L-glutamate ligase [Candidatus Gracilibacteria bacterium]
MRIGILSYYPASKRSSMEELRLVKAARELGHQARIIRVSRCQLVYDGDHPSVLHEGKAFPKFDVIIPRVSVLKNVELHTAILKQFELMGIPVVNRSRPINRAKNKLHTMQVLNHHGIGVPKTIVLRSQKYLDWAIKQVGGFPVIMKTPFGSYGSGVVIAESKRALASSLDALWTAYEINIALIQEYIKESKGRDIRLFVVGRKVVATMMRAASKGEFRSNIELGGAGEKIEVTPEEAENAIRATEVLGLEVSGVDLVRSNKGPLILEVNANPGFKKLEEVTGRDVARAIVEYAVSKVVKEEK